MCAIGCTFEETAFGGKTLKILGKEDPEREKKKPLVYVEGKIDKERHI